MQGMDSPKCKRGYLALPAIREKEAVPVDAKPIGPAEGRKIQYFPLAFIVSERFID